MRVLSTNTLLRSNRFPSVLVMVSLLLSSFLTSDTQAKPARDVAEKTFPSVVMLVMQDSHGQPTSLGSGFFVKEDVVATNLHVIKGAQSGYVKIVGKKPKYDIAGFVAVDRRSDLVLLKVQKVKAPTLVLADNNDVAVGDEVYAVGNPQGLEGTFSKGIVSGIRKFGEDSLLQITAPISPGSSGGPVLNTEGKVIGVAAAIFKGGQNLNFAIPSNYLQILMSEMKSVKPLLGGDMKLKNEAKSVFDNLGGRISDSIIGTHFRCYQGTYYFSLCNKLRQSVTKIIALMIFYDINNEPIDMDIIKYDGIIPAGLAKRLDSQYHSGTLDLLNVDSNTRIPKSRIECRILDFQILESEDLF